MSPNKKESVANRFNLKQLRKALLNHKERLKIKGKKNPMYKKGLGELYERIRINKIKVRVSHIIYRLHYKIKIPKGYHIHHIDENKRNNNIDNLQLLKADYHAILNLKQGVKNDI